MLIESGVEAYSTMLDAGVGDGLISEYLMRKKNLKIFGLDISSFVCEKATKRGIPTEVRDISNGLGLDSLLQELRWPFGDVNFILVMFPFQGLRAVRAQAH